MTLKEELEILRGEPIEVFDGDPMDIPCIETSDAEKLCKHPVVSVHMLTYNHEPYIRQAIEGVMMQKTDFEFELVIGEDCSQDKTREICFEYQKKYPDKIRVLWWHENVLKLGGNGRRNRAHCRGEFIAFCEGDDYWIDPLKLQKQVDVMRQHPNVGICFCGAKIYHGVTGTWEVWNENNTSFNPGVIKSKKYMLGSMFGLKPSVGFGYEWFQMTATFLFRAEKIKDARHKYDLFNWKLRVGDGVFSMGVGALSDAYYLKDVVSVYRRMPSGVSSQDGSFGMIDTLIIRLYYLKKVFDIHVCDAPERVKYVFLRHVVQKQYKSGGRALVRKYLNQCVKCSDLRRFFIFPAAIPRFLYCWVGHGARFINRIDDFWRRHICKFRLSRCMSDAYRAANIT